MPEICPVLALGIYWMCFSFDPTSTKLFPGGSQYERFRIAFSRFQDNAVVANEFFRRGKSKDDIGTHSMRKGSATFCASGSTACPSAAAIHLRAGWSLGGVQNTYMRYEGAGDMYVGRTVCGLPSDSANFATLPPHFVNGGNDVKDAVRTCFSSLPDSLHAVAEYALASVVYHSDFLSSNLHARHRMRYTALFTNPSLMQLLKSKLHYGLTSDVLRATGIPPHISLLTGVEDLKNQLSTVVDEIKNTRQQTVNDIVTELEARAVGAGTVTYDGLEGMINRCLDSAGLSRVIDRMDSHPDSPVNTTSGAINTGFSVFNWGGGLKRVPETFELPECSEAQLWQFWCCGNEALRYPPYRLLTPSDMNSKNKKKRLSDMRYLMLDIEDKAKLLNIYEEKPSSVQAANIYRSCKETVQAMPVQLKNGRKRRIGQLGWRTVVNIMRKRSKDTVQEEEY
jgi:hypothetical protein